VSVTQHGYLVIADITGYTSYVAKTELEHSQDVLTQLLKLIVDEIGKTFNVVKLEGDAVFARVSDTKVEDPTQVYSSLFDLYVTYRDRVASIVRATTCPCKACESIPDLDLKFFLHHGDYVEQNVSGILDLVGADVNILHRLTKNTVSDTHNYRAYMMVTDTAFDLIKPDIATHDHSEEYEHVGEVSTKIADLHTLYHDFLEDRVVNISKDEADVVVEGSIRGDLKTVWGYMAEPEKKNELGDKFIWTAANWIDDQGVGSVNHCAHDGRVSHEIVLDWKPHDYFTVKHYEYGESESRFDHFLTTSLEYEEESESTKVTLTMKLANEMNPITRRMVRFLLNRGFSRNFPSFAKETEEQILASQ
jgi:class 3 adenylate cyclase